MDLIKRRSLKCVIATIPTVNAKTASAVTTASAAKTANAAVRSVKAPIRKKQGRQKKKKPAAAAKNENPEKAERKLSALLKETRMNTKIKNFVVGGSFVAALFHFICCGLPALSILLGGMLFLPRQTLLNHHQMGYMLIVSGGLLIASFYMLFSKKCCCVREKHVTLNRIVLYLSLLLYVLALVFHIWPQEMHMEHMMH